MPVSGNITLLTTTHDSVMARQPNLVRYIPQGQDDWQPQIDKGVEDAIAHYHAATDLDPARAVPKRASDWARVLEFFACAACYEAMGREYEEERAFFAGKAKEALDSTPMSYDKDNDGAIDEIPNEQDAGTVRELRLTR